MFTLLIFMDCANLSSQVDRLEGFLNRELKGFDLDGLGEIVIGSLADRLYGALDAGMSSHRNDKSLWMLLANPLKNINAVFIGQPNVQKGQVRTVPCMQIEALFTRLSRENLIILIFEDLLEKLKNDLLVIDHKNRWIHRNPRPVSRSISYIGKKPQEA